MRSLRFPHFWSCLTWQVVTLDAMGTQKSAHQIQIIFSVLNHPTLFQQVEQWFQQMQADGSPPHVNTPLSLDITASHTHRLDTLGGLVCCPLSSRRVGCKIVIVERTRRLSNHPCGSTGLPPHSPGKTCPRGEHCS